MIRDTLIGLLLFFAVSGAVDAQEPDFSYEAKPLEVRVLKTESKGGVEIRDITFAGADGKRIAAFLVIPSGRERAPAALYVHWYASSEPDSNRFEFLDEAIDLARRGQASLLVETMWSVPAWYGNRVQAEDYATSVNQVKNLRRALDVLAADPRIDRDRIALVGHDFGGMYGTLAAAADARVKALGIMAATGSFSDWYMYGKFRLDGEAYKQYVAKMAPLDPVKYMAKLTIPVLMQFAESDFYVPRPKIEAFRKALPNSKPALLYDAGHGLDWQATRDRKAFLIDFFKLRKEPADVIHAYLAAREEGDPAKIESFHTADFREIFMGTPGGDLAERKNYYEFDKVAHGHFEYRMVETAKESVTLDLYESNDLFEALGCGVRRERMVFRMAGGKIREEEMISVLDARAPFVESRKAFVAWALKERPDEAAKFIEKGRLRMNGVAVTPMVALAKEWSKTVM